MIEASYWMLNSAGSLSNVNGEIGAQTLADDRPDRIVFRAELQPEINEKVHGKIIEEPETWISWTDDGIYIFCRKLSCMTDGPKTEGNPSGKYWGMFDIPGCYRNPRDIDKAFMQHRVDHAS